MCNNSKEEALAYIVLHHSKVNEIYQREDWNPGGNNKMKGYTLLIESIDVREKADTSEKSYVFLSLMVYFYTGIQTAVLS